MKEEGKTKRVTKFTDIYLKLKRKAILKILREKGSSKFKVTFSNEKLAKLTHQNRRVGKPRQNWAEITIKEIWEIIKQNDDRFKYTSFDHNNTEK